MVWNFEDWYRFKYELTLAEVAKGNCQKTALSLVMLSAVNRRSSTVLQKSPDASGLATAAAQENKEKSAKVRKAILNYC